MFYVSFDHNEKSKSKNQRTDTPADFTVPR